MTRRHGPLTALAGDAPAVAVGDVDLRHVRLTLDGIAWHKAGIRRAHAPWGEVDRLAIEPPKTWWPHPLVGDWVMPLVEAALGGTSEMRSPEPYFATVVIGGGDEELWEIDRHHVSGYRRRDARAAERLVAVFAADPAARALLAQPEAVVARVAGMNVRR